MNGFGCFENDLFYQGVSFRVNACHVQGVVTATNAQEARTLFKGFYAQACNLHELVSVTKSAMGFTPPNNRLGNGSR